MRYNNFKGAVIKDNMSSIKCSYLGHFLSFFPFFSQFYLFFNIHFKPKRPFLSLSHKNKQNLTIKKAPKITNRKNKQILTYEKNVKII